MNCFNHPEITATGACKACGKGICGACSTDLGYGLACKSSHEQRVEDLEMVISRNIKAFSDASKNQYIVPVFYLFMGLIFSGYSVYAGQGWTSIGVVLGGGFIAFGLVLLIRNRKIFSDNK